MPGSAFEIKALELAIKVGGIAVGEKIILSFTNVNKSFAGVHALKDVSFEVEEGTVHGICGENGAGKSTLMKILSGVYKRDSGTINFQGKAVSVNLTPKESLELGISIIYQEFSLVNELSVAENIFLDRLTQNNKKIVNWKTLNGRAQELLNSIGYDLDVTKKVRELSVGQKQMVEMAKALSFSAKLIIMDEPSATLSNKELNTFFEVINTLKKKGITILYISHKLDELFALCSNVTIMRDGQVIGTKKIEELTKDSMIQMMVGRSIDQEYPSRISNIRDEILRVENISWREKVKNVSFTLHRGEVLGVVGLVGAGRTELMQTIFGISKKDAGEIFIKGNKVEIHHPDDAIKNGLILLTEDRKGKGLFLDYTVSSNVVATNVAKIVKGMFISSDAEAEYAEGYVQSLRIKTPGIFQKVQFLSGGNQQKVVVAKSLFVEPDILIMDEPTRGIDVGAKYEIYALINELVTSGKSVILISSELPEVLSMSDRVIVLSEGKLCAEFKKEEFDSEKIMNAALGD